MSVRQTNIILNTDSYKVSMFAQYPKGTTKVYSYLEARGPLHPETVFFGLQGFIKEYLLTPITQQDIDQATDFYQLHGLPFNKEGWLHILAAHQGYLPLEIKALPEGTVVPVRHVLVTAVNTDDYVPWLTTWIETALVRAIWYPSTVATKDLMIRRFINQALMTSGDVSGAPFKLHDFGARGASSFETASIGGAAHMLFFAGTDTVSGVTYLMDYYHAGVVGTSIPAAEHSTIIAWGKDHEQEAYQNMLNQFAKPGAIVAVVSDSYDIYQAADMLWGTALKDNVIASGATIVIRPDSGDPLNVNLKLIEILGERFGYDINDLGYKVLRHVRLIQGDGVTPSTIRTIIEAFLARKWSIDNIAFGMGSGLLQQVHRDELGFAMKASAIEQQGAWKPIFKQPVDDAFKDSKAGLVSTTFNDGQWHQGQVSDDFVQLRTIYLNGTLIVDEDFKTIQSRAQQALL